ncbi:MAG TPA: YbaK/EbsC family protein [Solirubrobacterales bacterium]|nr:YbaK/EbsC family protein [Solirubrobacterales bacterium]
MAEALRARGVEAEVQELPDSTRTAPEAATALGCDIAEIAKSLVFRATESGDPVLVIASGADRVDEGRLAEAVGEPIGKADADFVRERTGFGIGGVPPVGHAQPLPIYIEENMLQLERIWAAAGTPRAVFGPVTPAELVRATGARVVSVAARR